jgi:hypothetical protein
MRYCVPLFPPAIGISTFPTTVSGGKNGATTASCSQELKTTGRATTPIPFFPFSISTKSNVESAYGASIWMASPRLMLVEPVPSGQFPPGGGAIPVMSDLRQTKLIAKLLLTCAADTH